MPDNSRGGRWTGWKARKRSVLRPFPTLGFETLEDRTTPTTFTWSGAGATANWSNPANWTGGVAPTGAAAEVDDLVFPAAPVTLAANNDLSNAVLNSVTISGSGYNLTGGPVTLGLPTAGSGFLVVAGGAAGNTLAIDTKLGASAGSDQSFSVGGGGDLTVTGRLSGTTGSTLTKDGIGTLTLTRDNSAFTGSIRVNNASGVLVITNALALGSTGAETTIGNGSSLRLSNVAGTINEPLRLNGLGTANDGALLNLAGANTWAGLITLDSNAAVGVAAGTLNITGQVTDSGAGANLTKEGAGELLFNNPAGNTYRGLTTVNNGVLTAGYPLAFGAAGTAASGVVVNSTATGAGQIRLTDATTLGFGFTVINEFLTLNGAGPTAFTNRGALTSTRGNNVWAGPVTLGSPTPNGVNVSIGTAATTNLIVSGVVSSPNGAFALTKVDAGRLILNNANTYTGATTVAEGVLTARDSMALGAVAGGTSVSDGATLELQVEGQDPATIGQLDAQGRDLGADSVTNDPQRLTFTEPLTITGRGANNTGALRSVSGINRYLANITLGGLNNGSAIGVDLDLRPGHPTPDSTYFTNDYSLTAVGVISGGANTDFVKRGAGHLILPTANTYTGDTRIEEGWVTVQNNRSLGADIFAYKGVTYTTLSQTVQPGTFVSGGASLHLKPLTPASPAFAFPENLTISGTGNGHPYQFINGKGALMNLGGLNTYVADIGFIGQAGIGVEQVDPLSPSDLVVTGSTLDGRVSGGFTANGGAAEQVLLFDAGQTSGVLRVSYNFFSVPDRLTVYYPPRGQPGSTRIFDTGVVNGTRVLAIPFGPGTSTVIELIMNEGGGMAGTAWDIDDVSIPKTGGLVKFGSKRLNLQGDGTYGGSTEVREGTLRAQHDTALGRSSSGTAATQQTYFTTNTMVASAAVLELTAGIAANNGGVAAGTEVWNEQLFLNSPGQQVAVAGATGTTFTLSYGADTTPALTVGSTVAQVAAALNALPSIVADFGADGGVTVTGFGNVFTVVFGNARSKDPLTLVATPAAGAEVTVSGGRAPLVNLTSDNAWRGPVTLNSGTRVSTSPNTRLTLFGVIDDAANLAAAGSDLVKRGAGELVLAGANSYRGVTGIDESILTVANSRALGAANGLAATGTVVANNAQLQIQGSLTVAGESLTVAGSGPGTVPNFPVRWLNAGPGPTNNGLSPQTLPTAGRVTSVAVDPADTNVIYVATAGGGAWKSKNGGLTWLPLFDTTVDANALLFGGYVAVAASDPKVVYFATGQAEGAPNGIPITGQQDNYAGSGVYKSTDFGVTWTLLTSAGVNPLAGQSVTKLIVSPTDPNLIFVSSGVSNLLNPFPTAVPGVWRHNGTAWVNMTATISANRAGVVGQAPFDTAPPNTPGPDDDYRRIFPQTAATWSDLNLFGGTLYAALGESTQTSGTSNVVRNGVFRTTGLTAASPVWLTGTVAATPDSRPAGFLVNDLVTQLPRNGYIKLAVGSGAAGTNVYASVVQPDSSTLRGQLLEVQRSIDGGQTFTPVATPPAAPFGTANPMTGVIATGRYNHTLLLDPSDPTANTVFLGGLTNLFRTTDGGTTAWPVFTPVAGTAPAGNFHDLFLDSGQRLLTASDGGVWRYDGTTFTDINGDLAVTQLNSADAHPFDLGQAFAGSADNGTQRFTAGLAWARVDDAAGSNTGVVRYDPSNPNTVYAVRDGLLRKSVNGGTAWATLTAAGTTPTANYFPLVVDPISPNRLLIGGSNVRESQDGGANFVSLAAGLTGPVTAIGQAGFQGTFVADTRFPTVLDKLTNVYDPDTIYATDGATIRVTKNRGVSWVTATPPGAGTISDIAVDPGSRDTVYVTRSQPSGLPGGRVYRSTNAGQTWTDITGAGATALPNTAAWRAVVDPRNGTLYVGTDNGVWSIANAATATGAAIAWTRFGQGMPRVQVKDLVLSQTLNTLTAGTYGRSVYQLLLTDYAASSGAVRAVSGASTWTGPVTLTGPTSLGASGTQNIQNGIAAASLNILGMVADSPTGGNFPLTKIGLGTITLSGTNTYGGLTTVQQGVLQVNNPRALGVASAAANTVVVAGAALELRSDLELEPVTVNGNGFAFNGHFTGALRNVSNQNTYTGPLTFGTDTTIGVDSGSQLTIGRAAGLMGTGTVTGPFAFDKELTGTLVLASANAYTGLTRVVQGAVRVQDALALGTPANGTVVLDGAAVQISRNATTLAATAVTSEPLSLSGTGQFGTGALVNVRGDASPTGTNDNTWLGPITLTITPNFAPQSNPGSQIAFGASDARDTLTLDTVVAQNAALASFGIIKTGPGRVTLARANTYTGLTTVAGGRLRASDPAALGSAVSGEVQTLNVIGTTGTYTLTFNGQTTAAQAAGASAATIQAALAGLTTVGAGNVLVSETPSVNGKLLTVTFRGALDGVDVPLLVAAPTANLAVNVNTAQGGGLGTVVNVGATLEVGAATATNLTFAEVLALAGDGVGGAGALLNVTNDNTYAGPITLTADATVAAVAGTSLTLAGNVTDPTPLLVPAPRLRKAGAGTVVLPNATPYAGRTVIDDGVLRVLDPGALGVGRSERQSVFVYAAAGSFALSFNGQDTTALSNASTATAVQNALNALGTVGGIGGSVAVTSTAVPGGNRFDITFGGFLANSNVPAVAVAPVAVATVTDGSPSPAANEVQTVTSYLTAGTFSLTFNGQTTTALPFNATAAAVKAALDLLGSIGGAGGSVTVTGGPTYTITFGGALANTNLPQLVATPSGPNLSVVPVTARDGAGSEIQTVVISGTNGGFSLRLGTSTTTVLPLGATAAQVKAALDALPNAGGNTAVTAFPAPGGGTTYTVRFGGTLANANVAAMLVVPVGGTSGIVTTVQDGPEGTLVNSGGTLQVAGGLFVSTEVLTINGPGFAGQGALNNFAGNNAWAGPIFLGSNSTIGVTAGTDALTLFVPLDDGGNAFNLDKVGPGTLVYQATVDNRYTGTTTVRDGTLLLSQPTGVAIQGPLVVGDPAVSPTPPPAVVRETVNGQVADTAPVMVNATGTFDLNGRVDRVAALTVNGGAVTTGAAGRLQTAAVTQTGGSITVGPGGDLTSLDVTMVGGTISVGTNATLTAGNVTETLATITLGNAAVGTVGNVSMTGGTITVGTNAQLTAGTVTATADLTTLPFSTLARITVLGNGRLTAADVSLTESVVTAGPNAVVAVNDVTLLGFNALVDVFNASTFTARDVSVLGGAAVMIENGSTGTVRNLTAVGDPAALSTVVLLGTGNTFTTADVALTDAELFIDAGSTAFLTGNLTAGIGAVSTSLIDGDGTLDLGTAGRTFTVLDGPFDTDLAVTARIVGGAGVTLTKAGAGRLAFGPTVPVGVPVVATAGDVEVDTAIGPVLLAGGSLSGTGTVGTLAGSPAGAAVGTVSPGVGYAANPAGVLTAGATTFGPNTTLFLNLDSPAAGAPVAGTDHDQLAVTGAINLGGATLAGLTGPGLRLGDSFTIITATGGVSGTFAGGAVVYIDGQRFSVAYNANAVVLTKVLAVTTTTVTSSANPSTFGQDVTFTATVTPEPGAGAAPTTSAVKFFLDGTEVATVTVDGAGQATFTAVALSGGSHTVVATYQGDGVNLAPSTGTLTPPQVVEVPAVGTLVGGPGFISPNNSPGTQDVLTVATTVTQERAVTTFVAVVTDALGNAVRTVFDTDPGSTLTVTQTSVNSLGASFVWDGTDDAGTFVADGTYTVAVGFADQFGNTGTTNTVSVVVDNTSPTAATVVSGVRVIAPGTAATVPTSTGLTSTVGDLNPAGWTLTVANAGGTVVRTFTGTGSAVTATWDGRNNGGAVVPDGVYQVTVTAFDLAGNTTSPVTSTPVVVLTTPPTVAVTSNSPTTYGQDMRFTATVTLADAAIRAQIGDLLAGTPITFFSSGTPIGAGVLALTGGAYTTTITVRTFNAGTYSNIVATTTATTSFLSGTSPAYTHVVNPAPLTITADDQTKVYGQLNPPLTVQVPTGAPNGLVNGDTVGVVVSGTPTTTATTASGVGTYPITQGGVTANSNYVVTFVNGTLTVTPADLRLTIADARRFFKSPNPAFTFTAAGLVNGDTTAVVSGLNPTTAATIDSPVGTYPITAGGTPTAANYTIISVTPGTLTVAPVPPNIAVGSGAGNPSRVNVFSPAGQFVTSLTTVAPADLGFTGGIRTAAADFNNDGVTDIVMGTGPGTIARVVVIDGATRQLLFSVVPFENEFLGGVYVAAGDLNGDGVPELVITPDEGGGPRVAVFNGAGFARGNDYFGIQDPAFRGGARAAVGDVNGDGRGDLVVAAGFGGGPRIAVFDGRTVFGGNPTRLFGDIFVFEQTLRNGVFIAAGDLDGDGKAEVIAGGGPGGGPRILALSGADLMAGQGAGSREVANFFAGDPNARGGIRVAVKDLDQDLIADLVVGAGEGGGSRVIGYRGVNVVGSAKPAEAFAFDAVDNALNGVYVG